MKQLQFMLLLFLTTLTIMACNKEDDEPCVDEVIATKSLETEYGCPHTKYQMEIDLREDFTILRSQESYDSEVSGSCLPTIDFANYDLVIGKQQLSRGNATIDYRLTKDCVDGRLVLRVDFNQNKTAEAPDMTYHALVPKLDAQETIEVQIKIND